MWGRGLRRWGSTHTLPVKAHPQKRPESTGLFSKGLHLHISKIQDWVTWCLFFCFFFFFPAYATFLKFFLFFYFLFFLSFCYFFGPLPRHMEVPRLGVESELQPPAYARATATRDPSLVCSLHHSSWQRWIVNPLSKARDRTYNLMVPSRIH